MEATTPKLKTKGHSESLPAHKVHHAKLKREAAEWRKNKTMGFIRCMTDVTIDDGAISRATRRNFFELKSFGQTMHWSLDKVAILSAKKNMEHSFLEEREMPDGKTEKISVKPRHLTVWEYNPRTSEKKRIV